MAEPLRKEDDYDDNNSPEAVTGPDLKALEGGGQTTEPRRGHLKAVNNDDSDDADSSSPETLKAAEKKGGQKAESNSSQAPDEGSSLDLAGGRERFFKGSDKPKRFRLRTPRGTFYRNGRLAIGLSASLLGFLVGGFTLFSFLNVFKLDSFLRNIDAKTFSRYNAQFSNRSDAYVRAYIRVRMLEFADTTGHYGDAEGNIFFRASSVDTNKSFNDWYRTMRTSNFEKDLAEKQGIIFTSSVDKNGHLRPAKITLKDDVVYPSQVSPQVQAAYQDVANAVESRDPARIAAAVNKFGPEMDQFVDTQFFESHKAARRAMADELKSQTRSWQVLKRRYTRKAMQNMIGVRNWTFFEKTTQAYLNKKTDIQRTILSKLFPDQNAFSNLLSCIFIGEKCNTNSDVNDAAATSETVDGADKATQQTTDEKGKTTTTDVPLDGSEAASEVQSTVQEVATEQVSSTEAKKETTTISERVVNKILSKFFNTEISDAGSSAIGDPTKWWKWAKRLAKIDNLVFNGTISKMVKKARLDQYVAIYAMYATARDQMKTGQVNSQQVSDLMGTLNGFDNTEAWQNQISGSAPSNLAAAASQIQAPAKTKQEYCSGNHIKQPNEFAWFCDDQKPNNGGGAASLENSYKNSVGYLIHPIALAVNGLNHIPIVSTVVNTFTDFASKITGSITDAVLKPALDALGITSNLGKLMSFVTQKLLAFLGAGPIFTGKEPGAANFITAGSAATAENSARAAGGVASTPTTLDYNNKVAAAYQKEQTSQESLFNRYASINNPDSLAAKSLLSMTNMSTAKFGSFVANIFNNVGAAFSSILTGKIFAAQVPATASSVAQWSGVDTYDIPSQCQNLDPLDPNYVSDAVGVQQDSPWASQALGVLNSVKNSLTPDNERDQQAFWQLVYDKIGNNPDAESIAGAIYNCATFDRQVEGGLGYLYGYTDDGGLNSGQQPTSTTSSSTPSGNSGYTNPFRDVPNFSYSRIDQGVDYNGSGPVHPLGNATLIDVNPNSGWPGNGQNSGGTWISYQLKDGPAAGKYVYIAEDCNVNPAISNGQDVTPDTVICTMYNGHTAIETGWAQPGSVERAMAFGEYHEGLATSFGQNFNQLMQTFGYKSDSVDKGTSSVPLPPGWPTW